jgi:hypothetical protein
MTVETTLGYVYADEDGALFIHDPTCKYGLSPSGCPGLGLQR